MEYCHPGSPTAKKFKTVPSRGGDYAHHLLGCKGVFYTKFLTKGSTVNSDRYCATLRSLKQRIRRIRPERNTFLLHHDNARPHCSAQTQDAVTSLKFTVVLHPSYSPDLAPSDFWLFPKLKETLKGQHFSSDDEVEAAVWKWISRQPETFFIDGIQKWIERLKKMCSRKSWLCWKIRVQCVREINFFFSYITVILSRNNQQDATLY
jgi:histone-lysine N-methyltransferase SETMAR